MSKLINDVFKYIQIYFTYRLIVNVSPLEVLVTRNENPYQNDLSLSENQS